MYLQGVADACSDTKAFLWMHQIKVNQCLISPSLKATLAALHLKATYVNRTERKLLQHALTKVEESFSSVSVKGWLWPGSLGRCQIVLKGIAESAD